MGFKWQIWVSWSAVAPFIANMMDPITAWKCWLFLFQIHKQCLKQQTSERRQNKCSREENKIIICCYLKSNPTQRDYRKRKIRIWKEAANFCTTSQRFADQARMILKRGWFSHLDIKGIRREVSHDKYDQKELPKRDETQSTIIETLTKPSNTKPM